MRFQIASATRDIAEFVVINLFPIGKRRLIDVEHDGRFVDAGSARRNPSAGFVQNRFDLIVVVGAAVIEERVGEDPDIDRRGGVDRYVLGHRLAAGRLVIGRGRRACRLGPRSDDCERGPPVAQPVDDVGRLRS